MDPKSITTTKFCNKKIDNVTDDNLKKYILDDLYLKTNKKFHYNYARVYNDSFKKYLSNPHILCLKSSGHPYLLYCTQINDNNYCFLIDKKKKEGYKYPTIFILHYRFSEEIYNGTLFETELLRDNNNEWFILFLDLYVYSDDKLLNKQIMDRINIINDIVLNKYKKDSFCDICPIRIKRYFDMNELEYVLTEFKEKLNYKNKGIYFIPLKNTYSKILYMFKDDEYKKINFNNINNNNNNNNQDKNKINFKIIKSIKPEIFELYLKNANENGYIKYSYAHIPNIESSKFVNDLFQNVDDMDNIYVECEYYPLFNKWIPMKKVNIVDNINKLR